MEVTSTIRSVLMAVDVISSLLKSSTSINANLGSSSLSLKPSISRNSTFILELLTVGGSEEDTYVKGGVLMMFRTHSAMSSLVCSASNISMFKKNNYWTLANA
jgi:hypothetical protein